MTAIPFAYTSDVQVSGDQPAVVDFGATWCGPCRFISPIFETLASKYPGVGFYSVDVDELPDVAQAGSVSAVSTASYVPLSDINTPP